MRRLIFTVGLILGSYLLSLLMQQGGGESAADIAGMPTCEPGQSIGSGCLPPDAASVKTYEEEVKRQADMLNSN